MSVAEIWRVKMNDMLVQNYWMTIVPLVSTVVAYRLHANSLGRCASCPTWDTELWNIAEWHRVE